MQGVEEEGGDRGFGAEAAKELLEGLLSRKIPTTPLQLNKGKRCFGVTCSIVASNGGGSCGLTGGVADQEVGWGGVGVMEALGASAARELVVGLRARRIPHILACRHPTCHHQDQHHHLGSITTTTTIFFIIFFIIVTSYHHHQHHHL